MARARGTVKPAGGARCWGQARDSLFMTRPVRVGSHLGLILTRKMFSAKVGSAAPLAFFAISGRRGGRGVPVLGARGRHHRLIPEGKGVVDR